LFGKPRCSLGVT